MDSLRTPSWRREEDTPLPPEARERATQPAGQPAAQPPAPPTAEPLRQPETPGNTVSGTGIPLAVAAAMDGVPSVQALRKRIKKGTLRAVRVLHRDSIVVGIELEELERQYPGATQPPLATSTTPAPPTPPPSGSTRQPDNPKEGSENADPSPPRGAPVAQDEQPDSQEPEQPAPTGHQALQSVDMAVQGWREAREALENSRREHREEITRTIASYEGQLQARDLERAQALKLHGAREVRWARWGLGATITLVAALATGVWLATTSADRLADERVRAGILTEQKAVLSQERLTLQGSFEAHERELKGTSNALRQAVEEVEALNLERRELQRRLGALEAERARAKAATRAALRAMGAR